MSELVEEIRARGAAVRRRIVAAGGDLDRIKIVAVTKGFGPEHLKAALEAGFSALGENYADELLAKWDSVKDVATWHFLGAVQRNKIGRLAGYVDCWQAVARVIEGEAIDRHRATAKSAPGRSLPPAAMLVEVETTGAPGRGGCAPQQVAGVVEGLRKRGCHVEGLMTVAPFGAPAAARASFDTVARLCLELELGESSMGMSDDFEQAVAAGATMVRLGTALFGPRPQRPRL
jgi:uncharacterized pyridoxal phosphate-containing UPF0001 family protein